MKEEIKKQELVKYAFNYLLTLNGTTTTLEIKNFIHANNFTISQKEVSSIVNDLWIEFELVKSTRKSTFLSNSISYFTYTLIEDISEIEDDILPGLINTNIQDNASNYSLKHYKEDLSGLSSDEINRLRLNDNDWICRLGKDFDNNLYLYDSNLKVYQARQLYVLDSPGINRDNVRMMRVKSFVSKKQQIEDVW